MIYCERCKYYKRSVFSGATDGPMNKSWHPDYDECHFPANRKVGTKNAYHGQEVDVRWVRHPKVINATNDCGWFTKRWFSLG
jgi:hypothetical protein